MYVHRSYCYRGASHIDSGTECQDASASFDIAGTTCLALADGHGDGVHSRSATGAALATLAVRDTLTQASGERTDHTVREIMRRWCALVADDIRIRGNISPALPARPYGCTCLAARISAGGWEAWQLGDGIVMMLDAGGNILAPVPADPCCTGDVTTSMCMASNGDWRRAFGTGAPRIMALASDGLVNCFADSPACAQAFIGKVDECCRAAGITATLELLGPTVDALAREGSRDDVSLAIALNTDYYGR